jgi:hypothetical protein
MQFSKTSKKTRQNAEETAAVPEIAAQAEVNSNPRTTRSSKSKSSSPSETGAVKHRKSASKPAAQTPEPATVAQTAIPVPAKREIKHEDIALLAHSYWVARGYAPGSPEQDWLEAERELKAKL